MTGSLKSPRRAGVADGRALRAVAKSCGDALSFRAPGTISSLGVRHRLPGPSTSVRRHNRTAFYLRHPERDPQHRSACQLTDAHHPSVPSILRHSVPVSVLHMKGQKPWNFLGRRRSEEIWKAA